MIEAFGWVNWQEIFFFFIVLKVKNLENGFLNVFLNFAISYVIKL